MNTTRMNELYRRLRRVPRLSADPTKSAHLKCITCTLSLYSNRYYLTTFITEQRVFTNLVHHTSSDIWSIHFFPCMLKVYHIQLYSAREARGQDLIALLEALHEQSGE